jgi:hypothetical protein
MDAPSGGDTDAELLEALRVLESHIKGTHVQFERIKRLMRLRQIRTVAMPIDNRISVR